jgi:hypothetical protein
VTIEVSNHDVLGGHVKLSIGPDGVGGEVGLGVGAGTPEASVKWNDELPKTGSGIDAKVAAGTGGAGASAEIELTCSSGGACSGTGTAEGTLDPFTAAGEVKGSCDASGCSLAQPEAQVGIKQDGVTVSRQLSGDKVEVKVEPPEAEAGVTGYVDFTSSRSWTWNDIGSGLRSLFGIPNTPPVPAAPPQPEPAPPAPTPTPSPTPDPVPVSNPNPPPVIQPAPGPLPAFPGSAPVPVPGAGAGFPLLTGAGTLE